MYRVLTLSVFVMALLLRLFLCGENFPRNAYDDHYEPIALILQTGNIPAKDACFQCYQPPVYYYSSALIAKALTNLGMTSDAIKKSLQFLNCFYCILTLLTLNLILKRLHLSKTSRFIAFNFICFLPRHIFMSAIHSNDGLSFLCVSLCTLLLLVTIDLELSWPFAALLGVVVTITVFVKYTTFLVLPMVALPLVSLLLFYREIPRSKSVTAIFLVLILPSFFLGNYMYNNFRDYGRALPFNETTFDCTEVHPRDPEGINFASFTPLQYIHEPILMPGQMHSFWTLIYSGMWADIEGKFTYVTDRNDTWWRQYFLWMNGKNYFPHTLNPISNFTLLITAGLLILGLVPLGLIIVGLAICLHKIIYYNSSKLKYEAIKLQAFPLILAFNSLGIILLVNKFPVYDSMKASYFLNSLPSFCVFIALGIQSIEKRLWIKPLVITAFYAIMLLAWMDIYQIIRAFHLYRLAN